MLGELSANTKSILFVFHGQGQLAEFFVQKFKVLNDLGITIIAPEGLHQYYLQGFSGRVGAGWMTSENRLVAIDNYLHFINAMFSQVKKETPTETPIHVLGFSQGAATASRWIAESKFDFEQLILWGGALPPDLNKELIFQRLKGKKLIHAIGNKDPFIGKEKVEDLRVLANNYGLATDINMYEGAHDIEQKALVKLFSLV